MADRIITAQAIIKAKDETGGAFAEIAAKIKRLEGQMAHAGKATALMADLDRVQAKLAAIEKFRGANDGLNRTALKLRETQIAADGVARAMAAAAHPTRALVQANEAAQRAASRANEAFEKQKMVLQAATGSLREAGISTRQLASAESHLKASVDGANAALSKQAVLAKAAAAEHGRVARMTGAVGRDIKRGAHGALAYGLPIGGGIGAGIAFGAYEAAKFAAREEMAYLYTQLAAGVDPRSPEGKAQAKNLRATAEGASRGTVFARPAVAKMMPAIAGMADVPLHEAIPFMPGAIQFAELTKQFGAAQGKHYEAHESAAAAIRLGHLMGITDPRQMMPVLNAMVPAITTAAESPTDLVNVLQYMMGAAAGVGMSNAESVNLGTLGAILVPGSRAGTSLNMMLTGMMPKGGPGAGTKIARKEAHRRGDLIKMGLIDPKTRQLFRDEHGGMLVPMIEHLNAYYEKNKKNPSAVYGKFTQLFEQRGARIAFEMARNPKMAQMARELEERQRKFEGMGGVPGVQQIQNETVANQALRLKAGAETLLTDLGESSRGPLKETLQWANEKLDKARAWADANPEQMQGGTMLGGGAALAGGAYLTAKWLAAGPALTGAAGALAGSAAELTAAAAVLAGKPPIPGMGNRAKALLPEGAGAAAGAAGGAAAGGGARNVVGAVARGALRWIPGIGGFIWGMEPTDLNAGEPDYFKGMDFSRELHWNKMLGGMRKQAAAPSDSTYGAPSFWERAWNNELGLPSASGYRTGLPGPSGIGAAGDLGSVSSSIRASLEGLRAVVDGPVPVDVTGKLEPVKLDVNGVITVRAAPGTEIVHTSSSGDVPIRGDGGASMPSARPGQPPAN